jgi:LPS export ABC transporter protein LptC
MRVILFTFILISFCFALYPQQKIQDFYLSNFKEDGSRDWEVKGDQAIVYEEHVDIEKMKANYYVESDQIAITSDEARLKKGNMDVFLKDNVHISNKDGATLTTDSLNWERGKNYISTDDWVKTSKDSMQVTAKGLSADAQLRRADFLESVEAVFPDQESNEAITTTCSGPLEIEYNAGTAVFNRDVVVTHPQGKLFSDTATLFFDTAEKKIVKIICEGNVKIIRDNNVTFSQKATYYASDQRIVLEGSPRLVYFPEEKDK